MNNEFNSHKTVWVVSHFELQFMNGKIHSFANNKKGDFHLLKNLIWRRSDHTQVKLVKMCEKHIHNTIKLISQFDDNYRLGSNFSRDEWLSIFNMELYNRTVTSLEKNPIYCIIVPRTKSDPIVNVGPRCGILQQLTKISEETISLDREERALLDSYRQTVLDFNNKKAIIDLKRQSLEKDLSAIQRALS